MGVWQLRGSTRYGESIENDTTLTQGQAQSAKRAAQIDGTHSTQKLCPSQIVTNGSGQYVTRELLSQSCTDESVQLHAKGVTNPFAP